MAQDVAKLTEEDIGEFIEEVSSNNALYLVGMLNELVKPETPSPVATLIEKIESHYMYF